MINMNENQPLLRLETYFLRELRVVLSPAEEYQPDAARRPFCPTSEEISAGFEHREFVEIPTQHRIILSVSSIKGPSTRPWEFHLVIQGEFEVSQELLKKKDPRVLIATNGSSILYSTARDILLQATSRGPVGPVFLPTVRFTPKARPDGNPVASDPPK